MRVDERLKLGRAARGAFAFAHNRGRELVLQYACVLPPALRQTTEVRRVELPPEEELLDPTDLLPLRLGAGRFGAGAGALVRPVRARLVDARSAAGCAVHRGARHRSGRRAPGGRRIRR